MRRHLLFGSLNAPEIVKMANFRIWKQDMVLLIQHTRAYTTSITLTVCKSLVLHSMLQISSSVYQNRQHRTEISTLDGMGNGLSEVLNTVNYTDIHRHVYIYISPPHCIYILQICRIQHKQVLQEQENVVHFCSLLDQVRLRDLKGA